MYRLYHRPSLLDASGVLRSLGQVSAVVFRSLVTFPYRIRRAWQEQFEVRSLERLDDRLLQDIGIPRGHIPSVVKAVYDAAEAKREADPGNAGTVKVSLSDLSLKPCVNC